MKTVDKVSDFVDGFFAIFVEEVSHLCFFKR